MGTAIAQTTTPQYNPRMIGRYIWIVLLTALVAVPALLIAVYSFLELWAALLFKRRYPKNWNMDLPPPEVAWEVVRAEDNQPTRTPQ